MPRRQPRRNRRACRERAAGRDAEPPGGYGHERTTVTLELDDIQARVAAPSPHPLRRRCAPRAHRRPARRPGAAAPPHSVRPLGGRARWTRAGRPGRPWRSASRASRRWACRGYPRQLPAGVSAGHGRARRPSWATPARARPSTGSNRSGARTSTSRSMRWPRTPRAWRRRSQAPATPCGICRASHRSGSRTRYMLPTERTVVRVQGRHQQPRHRGQRHPRHQPARGTVQSRRIRPRLPERERRPARRCPSPRRSAATAATSSSASSTPAWRRSASTSAPAPRVEPRRSCWPPSSSAAGRAARRWCSPRSATTRSSGPTRSGTTPSSTPRGRRSRPQVPARRPRPSQQRTRLEDRRRRADAPDHPAEHQLRPDAARGRPRGRRRRSRHPVLLPPGAGWTRQFEFVKTQWINEGTFIGAPAEMDPLVGPNDETRRLHRPPATDPPTPHGAAPVRRQPRRRVPLHARPAGAALARRARHLSPPTRNIDTRNHETADPLVGPRALADPASDITDDFTFPARSDQAVWCWS